MLPPISVVIARSKDRYIKGLTTLRYDGVDPWIEYFAASTSEAVQLAARYVAEVEQLVDGRKRNQAWEPAGLLDLITQMEG